MAPLQPRQLGCRVVDITGDRDLQRHATTYRTHVDHSTVMLDHSSAARAADTGRFPHIFSLPGAGEHIEGNDRRNFQDGLGAFFPHSPVTSIGNSGLGDRLAWDTTRFEDMAAQRVEYAAQLLQRSEALMLVSSKSGKLATLAAEYNLDNGEPLPIKGIVMFSPAVVPPLESPKRLLQFPFRTAQDAIAQTSHLAPGDIGRTLRRLPGNALQLGRDLPVVANDVYRLLPGTPDDQVRRLVSRYKTLVITGDKDPVGSIAMWHAYQEMFPDNLKVEVVKDRGHAMVFAPDAPNIVARAIYKSGIYEA